MMGFSFFCTWYRNVSCDVVFHWNGLILVVFICCFWNYYSSVIHPPPYYVHDFFTFSLVFESACIVFVSAIKSLNSDLPQGFLSTRMQNPLRQESYSGIQIFTFALKAIKCSIFAKLSLKSLDNQSVVTQCWRYPPEVVRQLHLWLILPYLPHYHEACFRILPLSLGALYMCVLYHIPWCLFENSRLRVCVVSVLNSIISLEPAPEIPWPLMLYKCGSAPRHFMSSSSSGNMNTFTELPFDKPFDLCADGFSTKTYRFSPPSHSCLFFSPCFKLSCSAILESFIWICMLKWWCQSFDLITKIHFLFCFEFQ